VSPRFCSFLPSLRQRHRGDAAEAHLAKLVRSAIAIKEYPPFRCVLIDNEVEPTAVSVTPFGADRLDGPGTEPVDLLRHL
jgi:hypothetical protein